MGSLIAGVLDGLGLPAGLAGDGTPYTPSAPVQIGTSGRTHRAVAEAGSWQTLITMFAAVTVLGAVVLMYVVRQRTRVLRRRRLRRMAEAAAAPAEYEGLATAHHIPHYTPHYSPHHTPQRTRHAEPPDPERVT